MNHRKILLEDNEEMNQLLYIIMNKCNKLILTIHNYVSNSDEEYILIDDLKKIIADIESKLLVIFFKDTTVTFYDTKKAKQILKRQIYLK